VGASITRSTNVDVSYDNPVATRNAVDAAIGAGFTHLAQPERPVSRGHCPLDCGRDHRTIPTLSNPRTPLALVLSQSHITVVPTDCNLATHPSLTN
jgi:hypothetical protein